MKRNRVLGTVAALGMFVPLLGCGGGGTTPTPVPTPVPAPVRTIVGQQNWTAGVLETPNFDVTLGAAGNMDATVQWTFASNDVDIYVTSTSCASGADLLANRCTLLAKADGTTSKPERLSMQASAGVFRIWVVNFGPTRESGTLEVGVTR